MKLILMAMLVSVFSFSALACDGSSGKGKKEKQDSERITTFTEVAR
jgi:hypothetical protein